MKLKSAPTSAGQFTFCVSPRSMIRAARACQLLVNTVPALNETVIRGALRLCVHYLDMASHPVRNPFKAQQLRFDDDFTRRRRLALINAGAAPSVTNLLLAACADTLNEVDEVRIRRFEETESHTPISTWSAEVAHDEAMSRPRIYRDGRFRLARRFSEAEWFRFPSPIGESRAVLAAQDEAATLPRFIDMNDLDEQCPGHLAGVYLPEALSTRARETIMHGMIRRGFRFQSGNLELRGQSKEAGAAMREQMVPADMVPRGAKPIPRRARGKVLHPGLRETIHQEKGPRHV